MTTLAEVNASLGVTNIALSDVVKEQKQTNTGISNFVDFLKTQDTRDRREEIEEKREQKASVISRAGSAARAAGGRALGLGKAGLGLGKDLFSKLGRSLGQNEIQEFKSLFGNKFNFSLFIRSSKGIFLFLSSFDKSSSKKFCLDILYISEISGDLIFKS